MTAPSMQRALAPHTDERDPLELVARMLVPGGYRVPVEGRSSRPTLQPGDVAAAMALMRDPLQREAALAVATRAERGDLVRVMSRAYRAVVREVLLQRPAPLDLQTPADRWRLRLVTYDAVQDLVWPERRGSYNDQARQAKMRRTSYVQVYRCAMHVLQQALDGARREFSRTLFGRGAVERPQGGAFACREGS